MCMRQAVLDWVDRVEGLVDAFGGADRLTNCWSACLLTPSHLIPSHVMLMPTTPSHPIQAPLPKAASRARAGSSSR